VLIVLPRKKRALYALLGKEFMLLRYLKKAKLYVEPASCL